MYPKHDFEFRAGFQAQGAIADPRQEDLMRHILTFLVAAATLSGSVSPPMAYGSATRRTDAPGELKVEIQVDDIYIRKVLDNKVGALFADQFQAADPACRAAAVLVAQEAASNYAYWTTSVDLLKETGKGIEIAGKLGGAKTVAKAGQLAFTIASALEDEEPAAALGRALTAETVDWLAGQVPKSGSGKVDEQVKAKANGAKDKLVKALFPGGNKKAKTHSSTVGDCTVSVTPEIQFPEGRTKQDLGGIWLHIDGDCGCKKPLRLNSTSGIPTTFKGQTDDIKNCGLGKFAIHAFLPMVRLETSVAYAGTAVNLKDLASKAADLKSWVDDRLAGKESDKKPVDLTKELAKLTGQATTVSPVLRLKPIFDDNLDAGYDLYAKCNNCSEPDKPGSGQAGPISSPAVDEAMSVPEDPCRVKCSVQWDAWMSAATAEAVKKKQHDDQKAAASIRAAESELNSLESGVTDAEGRLRQADARVKGFRDEAARKGFDPRELGDIWTSALTARETAVLNLERMEARRDRKKAELAELKKAETKSDSDLAKLAKATAAAKAAYAKCADSCVKPKPEADNNKIKAGIDQCLVGTWLSESMKNWASGGGGILLTVDRSGKLTVDYSGMQTAQSTANGITTTVRWTGRAVVFLANQYGEPSLPIESVAESNIEFRETTTGYGGGNETVRTTKEGDGGGAARGRYVCTKDTLVVDAIVWITRYRRKVL